MSVPITDKVITDKHPHQKEIFDDETRFQIAVCGRQWGKTTLGIEKVLKYAHKISNAKINIIAPTRQMVKDLFWEQIKARARQLNWRITRPNESNLSFRRLRNNSQIILKSADVPDRLRGQTLDYVLLDEFAQMEKYIWTDVLRPALTIKDGSALFIGTPAGRNHFFEMYDEAGKADNWKRYQYKSTDSPYMKAEEIERARKDTDERTFRQEFEASFEDYEGRAYIYYDADTHCFERAFDSSLPVIVCCDFNVNPCIWEFGNNTKEQTYFFDELKQGNTDIWRMCAGAKDKLKQRLGEKSNAHGIIFYGDYTSSYTRDVAAVASSWQIIRDEFKGWNAEFRLRNNPRIIDRVNAFNSRLRTADGKPHLGHSKNCIELGKDMARVDMEMLMKKIGVGDRTHASDAVGYFLYYEYPVHQIGGRLA